MASKIKPEKELVQKVKEYVFNESKRCVCDCRCWCGLEDGYCPTYDCGSLDKLKSYSDRQWLNTIRKVMLEIDSILFFEEFVDEVLFEIKNKRPSKKGVK